jgi:hydroxymethylglutaryl-CoA lyase
MSESPSPVEIVEVSPRDGLQSDPTLLPTSDKVELITRAVRAGLRRIEVVSFVNPERVPQMADAEAVMSALLADRDTRSLGARYIGLVLNRRGLDRALEVGVDEINAVVVATDTFARKNQGKDTAGLVGEVADILAGARAAGLASSVTVAAGFGCPYEGEVSTARLASVLERVVAAGPDEVALADSIGVAVPADVTERVALARDVIGDRGVRLRCHFHNTRNTGLANAVAAVDAGVGVLDSSLGGIGGCPFAPNATGNIPTEDLLYLLHRSGHDTGIDLAAACDIVPWLEDRLGHAAPGYLAKAGIFPDNARGAEPAAVTR